MGLSSHKVNLKVTFYHIYIYIYWGQIESFGEHHIEPTSDSIWALQ